MLSNNMMAINMHLLTAVNALWCLVFYLWHFAATLGFETFHAICQLNWHRTDIMLLFVAI